MDVIVLPHPPFWFTTAIVRITLLSVSGWLSLLDSARQ
jgi:hypothetical protein